jgi:hypothetical protein
MPALLTAVRHPVARRMTLVALPVLATALTLAACGGSSSGGGSSTSSSAAAAAPGGGGGGGGATGGGGPAASGLVAALSGSTMQVQSQQNGQVGVTWSSSTKFTHTVTTTISAVKAGDCVLAVGPSGTTPTSTSFTAVSLQLTPATNGTCGIGAGRPGGGQRPSGFPGGGQRPSGAPGGGAGGAGGTIAAGKVTSVSGASVVIAAQRPAAGGGAATSASVTVKTDGQTKLTTTAATTSSSVQVGKCVNAQGSSDSTGTVSATSVQVSDATNGQCAGPGGFGRGGSNG